MLDICSVKEEWCPKLYESYDVIGTVKEDIANILGISKNTVVIAGAADNAGAAIGTGTFGDGRCNISIGTSGTVLVTSNGFPSADGNELHAFAHSDGGFYLMGCMLSAASCNKWFCENVLSTNDFGNESEKIDEAGLGKNNVFFLPYLMGERSPINDTDASGVFIGLSPTTTRSDMLLAVFEGVAFAIRDSIEVAKRIGINISKSKICGGGAKSPLWRKIFANVLYLELEIPNVEEGPSFGAAILAMIATGEYASLEECANQLIACKETVKPDIALSALYEERYEKFKKIYPEIKNLYKELRK
jgi:xylulokinase